MPNRDRFGTRCNGIVFSTAVFQDGFLAVGLLPTPYLPRSRMLLNQRSLTTDWWGQKVPSVPSDTVHAEPPPPSALNLLKGGIGV